MASLNQCNFIGNCADAPEVRTFQDGGKIATARIAVTERYTDRAGQPRENTEWVPVVFNGKLAEIAEKYVTKGSCIYVSGKFHTRSWQDQQGGKHSASEISVQALQLLDKRPQTQTQSAPAPQYNQPAPPPQYAQPAPPAPAFPPSASAPRQAPPAQPQYNQPAQPSQVQYGPGFPDGVTPDADLPFSNRPGY